MGKKIFVSYKYNDSQVKSLTTSIWGSTVRDYVDIIEEKIDDSDNIYKGESDDEDLSNYSEDTIWEKLKDRIYDSSITIVLISKGMKEPYRTERSQWIPWEIAYSLRETTRNDRTSHTNAVLAVVLPDIFGNYSYYITDNQCCSTKCRSLNTDFLFKILSSNMFNKKNLNNDKTGCIIGNNVYHGNSSYIYSIKWDDFIENIDCYLTIAEIQRKLVDEYVINTKIE